MRYSAYGCIVDSDLSLGFHETDAEPGVAIRLGNVDIEPMEPRMLGSIRYGWAAGVVAMDVPKLARCMLAPEFGITLSPRPGANERELSEFIEAIALPVLASLRGTGMFHGSAVAGKVGALVFLGEKGVGKSTLAARLSSQGYEVLCDDAVAILPPEPVAKRSSWLRASRGHGFYRWTRRAPTAAKSGK